MAWLRSIKERSPFWLDEPTSTTEQVQSEKNANVPESDLITQPVNPGELTLEETAKGGLGRHLGVFSTTFLV